ncbi:unnamed protein product [Oikopleura dioica]|uniref:Integrin alpha-2 domain-containing protein n=1 Tax=Oikopleura dioica TaxID=34765 RepID=E4YGR7_OIKDI|nr:unnamed protein product [Oikopleura dioica]
MRVWKQPGIWSIFLGTKIYGFNIEDNAPVEHVGEIDSFFGFSADISSRGKILIGAPKFQGNGSVYECGINFQRPSSCDKIEDPTFLDAYGDDIRSIVPLEDLGHRYLGASVKYSSNNEKIYCAPGDGRWISKNYGRTRGLVESDIPAFVRGEGDFRFRRFGSCWIEDEMYQLFSTGKGKGWKILNREESSPRDVVISALNTRNANGVLASYTSVNAGSRVFSTDKALKDQISGLEMTRKEGFKAGTDFIEFTFGPFAGKLLVGAPQFDGVTKNGIAMIFDGEKTDSVFFKPAEFTELDERSDQAGQQFGHSLALGKISSGGAGWLAIGAPTWTDLKKVKANLGRVYLYEMSKNGDFEARKILKGDEEDQFFGNAIVGAVDLNYDGFDDLIVASKNKISIFNGDLDDLINTEIEPQIIQTSSMTRQLTVARNLLLAGLPEDSTVKVYQTRPVIEVTFKQIMDDKLIPDSSVSETIVEWRACATFVQKNSRNKNGEKETVILDGSTVTVTLDSKYSSPRMTYNSKSELELPLRSKNNEMCTRKIQLIVKSNELSSKIEPIVLTAKVNPKIPEGKMQPILSPISKIELFAENIISIDQPSLTNPSQKLKNSIIMDTKNTVKIKSSLTVGPQQSYGAVLEYSHPLITANTTAFTKGSKKCEQKDGVRTCQIGNPLRPGDYEYETTFTFDSPKASEEISTLKISFFNENKQPQSTSFNQQIANSIVHNIHIASKTYVKSGEFPDEPVSKAFYDDEKEGIAKETLEFEVKFQIFNFGPANFKNIFERVRAFYPSVFETENGDKLDVLAPKSMKLQQTKGKEVLTTVKCDHKKIRKARSQSTDVQDATNFQNYGCENAAECHEIYCPAPARAIEFKDGHRLTLMINFEVDKELFYEVRNHSRIFTRMDLNIQEEDFKYGFGATEIQRTITNELQVQLKSLSRSEQIPFWIIIVAALSAFLIILIVVLIMWKKKCFEYGPKTTQATMTKAENAPMLHANTEDIQ